jgi:hypothetical protein
LAYPIGIGRPGHFDHRSLDSKEQHVRKVIAAFEVLALDCVEVTAFARDTYFAQERDLRSRGDRNPLARNLIAGARDLSQ